uniref:Uncharacterized protein n=1 Tax=Hemiselmis andersenii TaxID=464988 RepID=A0A6T8JMU3_HEMAN|mmetsp:Transcript_34898/g.81791  ORF Transcript_34898/g.81791 Transcript_34898/m.81791 type:complete len:247 (+) Transcript_34898:186-926(+)
MLARSVRQLPPHVGAISLCAARMMSVDPTAGRPQAGFMRPKGIVWTDRSGDAHQTDTVKPKISVWTGSEDERLPIDPYAPEVTPSQVRKLSAEEKGKVADMRRKLSAMNQQVYKQVEDQVQSVVQRGKHQAKRSEFQAMLRSWNPDAYMKLESETASRQAHSQGARRMAGLLRSMNPQAYQNVDQELGGCATTGVPKFQYRKGATGVEWQDSKGVLHQTKMVKKVMVGVGNSEGRSPIDPYRADAA